MGSVIFLAKLHDLLISVIVAIITGILIYFNSLSQMKTYPDAIAVVGMIMVVFPTIVAFIVLVILRIIRIIEYWKIFKHENIPCWKALIPFYCDYILCTITNTDVKWSFLEFTPIIIYITMIITYQAPDNTMYSLNSTNYSTNDQYSPILYIVIITLVLGKIVYSYVLSKNISKKFEKPKSFTWKLFFLPIIYYRKVVSNKKEIDYSNQSTPNINKIIEKDKESSTTPIENNNSLSNNIASSKEENNLNNKIEEINLKDTTVIPIETNLNSKPPTPVQENVEIVSNNSTKTKKEDKTNLSDLYK